MMSIRNIKIKLKKRHGDRLGGDLFDKKTMVKCNVRSLEM
jgi:hypothetical protein